MKPGKFQTDCLKIIIESNDGFEYLLEQVESLQLENVEHTGVGCIYSYKIDSDLEFTSADSGNTNLILDCDFEVIADTLTNGAGLIARVINGKITTLEVLAHGDDFPLEDPKIYDFKKITINYITDNRQY